MSIAKIKRGQISIYKTYPDTHYQDFFQEIYAYKRLNKLYCSHFVRMIGWNDEKLQIELEIGGGGLTLASLPVDWHRQIKSISLQLDRCGIFHEEIFKENLLTSDDCIKIIDFGRCKIYDQGFSVSIPTKDSLNNKYSPENFYFCHYIESYPDDTLFILSVDNKLRSIPTNKIKVKRTSVYNLNLAHLQTTIGNL